MPPSFRAASVTDIKSSTTIPLFQSLTKRMLLDPAKNCAIIQRMTIVTSRWLDSRRHYAGERPGEALVAWLNHPKPKLSFVNPQPNQTFVKGMLTDAQTVYRYAEQYGSLHKLLFAHRHKKLPTDFWKSHERLNNTLATFTHAPQIDLHEFYDLNGHRVSWTMVTEQSPIALLGAQVRWVLELIEQGAILKIRRCEQCTNWYFGRFSNQSFCSPACRGKCFSRTEAFKKNRRKYMRDYYHLKKSGKVK